MPHSTKGVIAGFIATVVMSIVMLLLNAAGLTQADIVGLIDRLGSIGRGGAWADHFLVGTMLWGVLFAGLDAVTPEAPRWLKGIIFGVAAWLAMLLLFMPVVGAGLFGPVSESGWQRRCCSCIWSMARHWEWPSSTSTLRYRPLRKNGRKHPGPSRTGRLNGTAELGKWAFPRAHAALRDAVAKSRDA